MTRSASWVYREEVGEPKTEAGRRLVVLPTEVLELLKPLQGAADAWVFPSDRGTPLSTGVLNKPLRQALKAVKIGKRVTTHGLRRTFSTLAMEQASGELVRKVLGHAVRDEAGLFWGERKAE